MEITNNFLIILRNKAIEYSVLVNRINADDITTVGIDENGDFEVLYDASTSCDYTDICAVYVTLAELSIATETVIANLKIKEAEVKEARRLEVIKKEQQAEVNAKYIRKQLYEALKKEFE